MVTNYLGEGAPFHDRDGFIRLDEDLLPWRDAKVHVLTHGLHYASCVFEGEKACEGRVFALDQHTERLCRSAQLLDFELPFSVSEIYEATRQVVEQLRSACDKIAIRRRITIKQENVWNMAATRFDPALAGRLRRASQDRGISSKDMISGAGHDAIHMALKCPTAMLFVPREDGVSHNEAENLSPEDAASGCQIVLDAILPLLAGDSIQPL